MPFNDGVRVSDHLTAQMEDCKPEEQAEEKPPEPPPAEEVKDDEQK